MTLRLGWPHEAANWHTKTKARPRTVAVVHPHLVALLEHALAHAEPKGGRLFRPYQERREGRRTGNWRRMLSAACRRAGIAHCSENDLRRTTAQWLRRAGVELELVSATLGHTTTRMVQVVYGRLDAAGSATGWPRRSACLSCRRKRPLRLQRIGHSRGRIQWTAWTVWTRETPISPVIRVGRVGIEPTTDGLKVRGRRPSRSGFPRRRNAR